MIESKIRKVILFKDYFSSFFEKQRNKVKDKILWTLKIIESQQIISSEYFKHIEGTKGLYEIRVKSGNDIFRIFCFFDDNNIIVLGNGFQKKTQQTPKNEIAKALRIKLEYELLYT